MLFKVKKNGKVSEEHMNTVSDLTDEITTLMDDKLGTEESKDIPRPASQQLFTVANPNSQIQQPTTSKIDSQKKKRKIQDTDIPRPASQQLFTVTNPNSQIQQPTTSKIDSQKKKRKNQDTDIPRPASQQLFTVANPNSQIQQPTTSKIDSQKKKRKTQDTNLFATTSATDIPTEPARTKELNWFCEYLNDQDMRNIHKKSLYSPKHSKNLNASLQGLTQQELNNLSRRKKRQCPQNRQTENAKRNLTRKERRNIPEVKDQENARRNETRSHRRSMTEVKDQEKARRNETRSHRQSMNEVREQESVRRNITRQIRRKIPEVRDQGNAKRQNTRKDRRSIPEVREQESARIKYFIGNSPLYQEEAIQLDTSWTSENTNIINFASETDIEVIESHEKLVQMQSAKNQRAQGNNLPHSKQNQEKNKLISDENDDNWVEQSDEEVSGSGNKDTLLQDLDFTDDEIGRYAIWYRTTLTKQSTPPPCYYKPTQPPGYYKPTPPPGYYKPTPPPGYYKHTPPPGYYKPTPTQTELYHLHKFQL
ncbi:uncharacterized protein DDB_G0284459-like [Mytilus californianus]|uniref:uncharacterized protein DDB_G0284459-like n=1 Tax=Mytilus californianus TaxID=6549 RepID=UPI002247C686|nr:uncharacterized protein DDB_G0284459-like [Mytilus californianus]